MYPGLPTRLEKDLRDRYCAEVLKGDVKRLSVRASRGRVLGWPFVAHPPARPRLVRPPCPAPRPRRPTSIHCLASSPRPQKLKLRIEDPPRRKHMVFLGGAVLGEFMRNENETFWITKAEYDEHGSSIFARKKGMST